MRFRAILLSILSGLLLLSKIYQDDLRYFCWVALVPLLVAIHGENWRKSFFYGLLTGLIYFGAAGFWLTMYEVRIYLLCLLTILPFMGIFCATTNYFKNRLSDSTLSALVPPALWITLMFVYGLTPIGSSALNLCAFQGLYLLQMVRFFGAEGITFLILAVNSLIAFWIVERKKSSLRKAGFICLGLVTALAISSFLIYGKLEVSRSKAFEAEGSPVSVAVLQPNFPIEDEWRRKHSEEIFQTYADMSMEAARQKAGIIVWPQYTLPVDVYRHPERVAQIARATSSFVILGTYTPPFDVAGRYNIGLVFSPEGQMSGEYRAVAPPPFREIGQIKGEKYQVVDTPLGGFGIMLCYDDVSPEAARNFVKNGAHVLFSLVNDGDFGKSRGPYLHFNQDLLRAVETNRYLVRAGATGISGIIDPWGRTIKRSSILRKEIVLGHITLSDQRTFYTKYPDLIKPMCLALMGLLWVRTAGKKGQSVPPE